MAEVKPGAVGPENRHQKLKRTDPEKYASNLSKSNEQKRNKLQEQKDRLVRGGELTAVEQCSRTNRKEHSTRNKRKNWEDMRAKNILPKRNKERYKPTCELSKQEHDKKKGTKDCGTSTLNHKTTRKRDGTGNVAGR